MGIAGGIDQHRCFYCDGRLGSPEVDHFLPWVRVSLDAIENLVVAHDTCNRRKTDHLAAAQHVERWRDRLDRHHEDLVAIAKNVRWETGAARTLGVARALYLPLRPGACVWSCSEGLIGADPTELRALLAA